MSQAGYRLDIFTWYTIKAYGKDIKPKPPTLCLPTAIQESLTLRLITAKLILMDWKMLCIPMFKGECLK